MLYLNTEHLQTLGIDWSAAIEDIRLATLALSRKDFAQPIKPYLRYRDPVNRIIAMPAFVGEPFDVAGIKWISSFPKNIDRGIQRAHSVTVVNQEDTGKPIGFINSALISGVRTAAVTGLVLDFYQSQRQLDGIQLGITGFGPIGRLHLDMALSILGERLAGVKIFDLRPIDDAFLPKNSPCPIEVVDSWQAAYRDAHVFMTCTVSKKPYIDIPPIKGTLQLNVSLRDYCPEIAKHIRHMVVDDWDEVCREETDIEIMHLNLGLQKEDTLAIDEMLTGEAMRELGTEDTVMFNPMGLAIYDVAIAEHYLRAAREKGIGIQLPD